MLQTVVITKSDAKHHSTSTTSFRSDVLGPAIHLALLVP